MKNFDFETNFDTDDFGLITVHAVGTISDYYPSKTHDAYGDPGYDAEGGVIEYDTLEAFDSDDTEITFPNNLFSKLDDIAFEKAY